MSDAPPILLVAAEPHALATMAAVLGSQFDVHEAASADEAFGLLEGNWIQAVFCDLPGAGCLTFLAGIRARWPDIVTILVADPAELNEAVDQAGIFQYITRPWRADQLLLAAYGATHVFGMQRELHLARSVPETRLARPRQMVHDSFHFEALVRTPESPLNGVCRQAAKAAAFDIPVLILGETGTGKELMARAVHYASQRSGAPFLAVNCGAIPDELLESELFGHRKGSFTGAHANRLGLLEQADGGTLLLDEIGDISPSFQLKLLRFLQEGEIRPVGSNESRRVDVRILSATHRNLREEVAAKRFREDLYFRISGMVLTLPALRERTQDIRVLAGTLLDTLGLRHGRKLRGFTDEALDCLVAYDWPGNVRELQNEVLRMLVLAEDDWLGADLLSPAILHRAAASRIACRATEGERQAVFPESGPLQQRIEWVEAQILMETIVRCRWNKSRTAKELGLSRVGLRAKLQRYGIAPEAARHILQ